MPLSDESEPVPEADSLALMSVYVCRRLRTHQRFMNGTFGSRANFSAVSGVIGFCLFLASFSTVEGSSRRSIWVPTNRNGVLGQCELREEKMTHYNMKHRYWRVITWDHLGPVPVSDLC
ncbi:hypothetical protein EYF80_032727 [Liparis tanakae]|uniref:Uncharacterized protein n=1 Tax=Liparis tanakae TaxID=230148 RepID=A0A4Z2GWC6_9TELE|nr:hypothetical protein EYF80_032727 [Liparis tanakae]